MMATYYLLEYTPPNQDGVTPLPLVREEYPSEDAARARLDALYAAGLIDRCGHGRDDLPPTAWPVLRYFRRAPATLSAEVPAAFTPDALAQIATITQYGGE